MAHAAGILTARGGLVSHAAVVARGWGIPAVVGATAVELAEGKLMINGRAFAAGEHISIDGSTGEVYPGDLSRQPPDRPRGGHPAWLGGGARHRCRASGCW